MGPQQQATAYAAQQQQQRPRQPGPVRNFLQAASNAVASNVSGPVDLIAMGMNRVGIPVGDEPVMGSAWMRRAGLTAPVQQGASQVLGETAGMLAPLAIASKAPQIASAANEGKQAAAELAKRHARQFQRYNQQLGPAGASHVVNVKGIPVAQAGYHGTRSQPFEKVSLELASDQPANMSTGAFWFADDSAHAGGYAGNKGSVLEIAAELNNPMILDAMREAKRIGRQIKQDVRSWDDAASVLQYAKWVSDKAKEAKARGFDSLVVKNTGDAPNAGGNLATHFAVFADDTARVVPSKTTGADFDMDEFVARQMAKNRQQTEMSRNLKSLKVSSD